MKKHSSQKQEVDLDKVLDSIANTVFTNLRLYVDKKFQELDSFFKTLDDTKINIATLSSLLYSKGLFEKSEFREVFAEIRESFGVVDKAGVIKGEVTRTHYNFT